MKKLYTRIFIAIIVSVALCSGCQRTTLTEPPTVKLVYPSARKDSTIDIYHGIEVADPYRWLEGPDSNETQTWVAQQNKLTADFLATFTAKDKIKDRLTNLYNYPRYSAPHKKNSRYFFWKNDGLQNQSVLYMQKTLQGEPTVVINPNLLSQDGTIALTTTAFSKDGTLLAYGLSESGSDRQKIKIHNVDSRRDCHETIQWCRFASIAWKHNNEGFFYNRFPDPNTVPPEDQTNYSKVYWHKLGTDQAADKLIYERPDDKELSLAPLITEDGKFLILDVYRGTDTKNRIYYRPIQSTEPFIKLLDDADASYEFIANIGSIFYFNSDLDAPRGHIIAIDVNNPARKNWRQIILEQNDVIDYVDFINNHFVIAYMHDVHHQLKI
ncbi:MAG: hypothetical protein V3W45_02060, partial [Sedimentisphaerales bacterium]